MAQKKSLMNNAFFNGINTMSSRIFPIITFAYATRVVGPDGIGKVTFVKSIIAYFTMLAMLGMSHYGVREVAKYRDDQEQLSKFVHEMLYINGCTTLIAYILLAIVVGLVPRFRQDWGLMLICSPAIILQGMGLEWMYQGLEEYGYITKRSLVFQVISLALMFIFVRTPQDVVNYAIVYTFATSGSYLLNFFNARKYVSLRRFDSYKLSRHIRPLLRLFALAISIDLYRVLDSTMLGFMQDEVSVGKYTAAIKVNTIITSFITAMGAIMIPRLSYYLGRKEKQNVDRLVQRAYNYVFMLSIPAAIGLFILCDEIILLLSGQEFASAGFTARILTPIMIVIPFSVTTNQQTFVPMGKENLILLSTCTGAVTNFIFNLLLIPRFAENGAAAATVLAESSVAVVCFFNMRRFFSAKKIFREYYQYWIAALPIPIVAWIFRLLPIHDLLRMGGVIAVSILSYFGGLYLLKNPYLLEVLNIVSKKVLGNRT